MVPACEALLLTSVYHVSLSQGGQATGVYSLDIRSDRGEKWIEGETQSLEIQARVSTIRTFTARGEQDGRVLRVG